MGTCLHRDWTRTSPESLKQSSSRSKEAQWSWARLAVSSSVCRVVYSSRSALMWCFNSGTNYKEDLNNSVWTFTPPLCAPACAICFTHTFNQLDTRKQYLSLSHYLRLSVAVLPLTTRGQQTLVSDTDLCRSGHITGGGGQCADPRGDRGEGGDCIWGIQSEQKRTTLEGCLLLLLLC